MKKLIRYSTAILTGVIVLFGTSVIAANIPPDETVSSKSSQLEILIPDNSIAKSSDAFVVEAADNEISLIHEKGLIISNPNSNEDMTLADLSPTQLQNVFEQSEEETTNQHEESIPVQREVMLPEKEEIPIKKYSKKEKILIARVVYSEARGEPFEGQVAVATVVLNRYESGKFGKSISKIVFAPNQFAITEKYNSKMLKAVEAAIEGMGDYPENMFYFQVSTRKTWRNFVYYKRIGNHSFYLAAE